MGGQMSGWTIAWLMWIVAGVTIEMIALACPGKNDTLSEHVWTVYNHTTWGKFVAWMLTAFLLWLTIHFVSRGKWG